MQAFAQAKNLDPAIGGIDVVSGNTYMHAGLYEKAIRSFRSAVKVDNQLARAHYNLGCAYLRMGDKALAVKQCQILEPIEPKMASSLRKLIDSGGIGQTASVSASW